MIKDEGLSINSWVEDMLVKGIKSFYSVAQGEKQYFDINTQANIKKPGQESFIILNNIRETKTIWSNKEASIQLNTKKFNSKVERDNQRNEYSALVGDRESESKLYSSIVSADNLVSCR